MPDPEPPERSADLPDDEGPASTPFDNPLFLPVLLGALALWLAYDGFTDSASAREWIEAGEEWKVTFNRWGAIVLGALTALFGYRAYRQRRRDQAPEDSPGARS